MSGDGYHLRNSSSYKDPVLWGITQILPRDACGDNNARNSGEEDHCNSGIGVGGNPPLKLNMKGGNV